MKVRDSLNHKWAQSPFELTCLWVPLPLPDLHSRLTLLDMGPFPLVKKARLKLYQVKEGQAEIVYSETGEVKIA